MREERNQIALKAGHHQPASETSFYLMAFRWQANDGPTFAGSVAFAIFQGIWTCIAKKPYIFVIFRGGGEGGGSGSTVPPS